MATRKADGSKPIEHRKLTRRAALKAEGKPGGATISLLDVSLDDFESTRGDPRGRTSARRRRCQQRSIAPSTRRYEQIPTIRLDPKKIDPELMKREIEGFRPAGVPTTFVPKQARPTHQLKPERGKDVDLGGTIFGTDDRYLFDDQSFPWRTAGKVRTVGKWGSGTTIGPRHVLTASHVINWTGGSDGGVAWVTFSPGYFDGPGPWGEIAATNVIYWLQAPGSLTDQQTAFDYVVLVMEECIGDVVGYPATARTTMTGGSLWQYTGYPGELF